MKLYITKKDAVLVIGAALCVLVVAMTERVLIHPVFRGHLTDFCE